MPMLTIDMSLGNAALYAGLATEEVAGRLNLTTPMAEAVHVIGRNARQIVDAHMRGWNAALDAARAGGTFEEVRDTPEWRSWEHVTLTGGMAIPAYLVVFHEAVHRFRKVYYHDGRGVPILIAAHG